MFFSKCFADRGRQFSAIFLMQLFFTAVPTVSSALTNQQVSPSPTATSTPEAPVCSNLTTDQQNEACLDFFRHYSTSEYSGVLDLPNRVQVVTGHKELVDCFDSEDNSVCENSKNNHYLILLEAHDFEIPDQVFERGQLRYSLKAVYPDTTVRLSQNANTRNKGSGALMRFNRTRQLIIDGITWDTHENTVNPAISPTPNSDDDPPEVVDLALDIRFPTGPVIICGNTFRHTGRQVRPTGFIDIRSPDPAKDEEGLVDIRDNQVDSSDLYSDMNLNDANNTKLLFIECRNEDRDNRSCENTYARITGNVFVESSEDLGSGSSLSSVPFSLTSTFNLSPSTTPEIPPAVKHSAIELKNIGKFIIEENRQEDMSALANIRIEYDNQQAISVDGLIRNNIGHDLALDEVLPTITLTSQTLTSQKNNLPVTGSIRIDNNSWYNLLNQLTLPELLVFLGPAITSSQASEIASQVTSVLTGSSFSGDLPATSSIDQPSMLVSSRSFIQTPGSTMIEGSPGIVPGGGLAAVQIAGLAFGIFVGAVIVIVAVIVLCVAISKSRGPVGDDTIALKNIRAYA